MKNTPFNLLCSALLLNCSAVSDSEPTSSDSNLTANAGSSAIVIPNRLIFPAFIFPADSPILSQIERIQYCADYPDTEYCKTYIPLEPVLFSGTNPQFQTAEFTVADLNDSNVVVNYFRRATGFCTGTDGLPMNGKSGSVVCIETQDSNFDEYLLEKERNGELAVNVFDSNTNQINTIISEETSYTLGDITLPIQINLNGLSINALIPTTTTQTNIPGFYLSFPKLEMNMSLAAKLGFITTDSQVSKMTAKLEVNSEAAVEVNISPNLRRSVANSTTLDPKVLGVLSQPTTTGDPGIPLNTVLGTFWSPLPPLGGVLPTAAVVKLYLQCRAYGNLATFGLTGNFKQSLNANFSVSKSDSGSWKLDTPTGDYQPSMSFNPVFSQGPSMSATCRIGPMVGFVTGNALVASLGLNIDFVAEASIGLNFPSSPTPTNTFSYGYSSAVSVDLKNFLTQGSSMRVPFSQQTLNTINF